MVWRWREGLMVGFWAMAGSLACARPAPVESDHPDPAADRVATPPKSGTCLPTPKSAPTPGPAFALVQHVGLLEIGAETSHVREGSKDDLSFTELAVDPSGALWISNFDRADLLRLTESAKRFRLSIVNRDGWLSHIAPAEGTDVWLATDEIEWRVAHYDRGRLRYKRRRDGFRRRGGYSDNKFAGLARVGDTAYVGCSDGLWRHDPAGWQRLPAPPPLDPDASPNGLFSTPKGVLVQFIEGDFLLSNGEWRPVSLPPGLRAVNESGLALFSERVGGTVSFTVRTIEDSECEVASPAIPAGFLYDVALDERGRTWAATDVGLTVIGSAGDVAGHWAFGELPGLDARVERLAVVGGGPSSLPAAAPAKRRRLRGRLSFSKDGTPVAGQTMLLCPRGFAEKRCAGAPFVRTIVSNSDGSFLFSNVPLGDFAIVVVHPEDSERCDGLFEAEPHYVSPIEDCPQGRSDCDLGELRECDPFEFPPE